MKELFNDKQEIQRDELPSKSVKDIDHLDGKDDGWVMADKLENKLGISYLSNSNLDKYYSALPGNESSKSAIPSLSIVDNSTGKAPIGRSENTPSSMVSGSNDTGAGAVIDTRTKIEQYNLVSHNPERMELSTEIINQIIIGGTTDAYKEQIADLSGHDRYLLAQDLHATASDYNQLRGLEPGVDRDALIVDVRVGKEDLFVNDIDIMRGFSSQEEPERVMERIDLYDPGLWTGLKKEGQEVDKKQALDAITAPYEEISEVAKEKSIAYWNTKTLDNPNDRRARDEDLENAWLKAKQVMQEDRLNLWNIDDYKVIEDNLEANSKNPDSALLTENTSPLFPESSRIARNELRPSERAEEAISSLRDWTRSLQNSH